MILDRCTVVHDHDATRFAWSGLRQFHNVEYVTDRISRLHQVTKDKRHNARKQARQLRYCLVQAKEYFDAAFVVSLATKPNVLYYCIMSLALAEILMKQSGLSSLDKMRDEHRHHGLELRAQFSAKGVHDLRTSASALMATPVSRSGERFGTFELWHRSAREMPSVGKATHHLATGSTISTTSVLLVPEDTSLPPLPESGITLFQCLCNMPGMYDYLRNTGVVPGMMRGRVTQEEWGDPVERSLLSIIVHPGPAEISRSFFENLLIDPNEVDRVEFQDHPTGGIARFNYDAVFGQVRMRVPHSSNISSQEIRFWPRPQPLNEFGYLYVALHIAGNYARYYPDRWLHDIEHSSPLALAIEEMLFVAERRMALLTLSELSGSYYVPEE